MENTRLLRGAAIAAVTGALAQLVATVLEPDWGGDADAAVRVVADSGVWVGDRLLDLFGVLLMVAALTVVGRTLHSEPGREWARVGQPFLVLTGALGLSAVTMQAVMKELADTWSGAADAQRGSYLAAFDAVTTAAGVLFFAAFLAFGVFLAALSSAILTGRLYPRWVGVLVGVAAALIFIGNLSQLLAAPAWLAVLAGLALALIAQTALGVSMWRHASTRHRRQPAPELDAANLA